jgi:hypothetical protein
MASIQLEDISKLYNGPFVVALGNQLKRTLEVLFRAFLGGVAGCQC